MSDVRGEIVATGRHFEATAVAYRHSTGDRFFALVSVAATGGTPVPVFVGPSRDSIQEAVQSVRPDAVTVVRLLNDAYKAGYAAGYEIGLGTGFVEAHEP